jgi:hypothetical protein
MTYPEDIVIASFIVFIDRYYGESSPELVNKFQQILEEHNV